MGLLTPPERSVWLCCLLLTISLVGITLIPVALVIYAVICLLVSLLYVLWSITRPPHRVPQDRLLELAAGFYFIIAIPLLCGYEGLSPLIRKARRRTSNKRPKDQSVRDDTVTPSSWPPSLYAPLIGECDVRILRIEPADNLNAPFELSLRIVSLDDRPLYDALSYTWADEEGDDARTVPVEIHQISRQTNDHNGNDEHNSRLGNGDAYPVFITKNCASALRRMRRADRPRHMWIDALCINQADMEERTSQVSLMARIYTGARHVVVYTGEATPLTDRLFDAVNQLPAEGFSGPSPWLAVLKRLVSRNTPSTQFPQSEPSHSSQHIVPHLLSPEDISELADTYFTRRWFTRVWVLQEVSLPDPRRTRIVCGAKTTTARRALQAIPSMQRHLPDMASRALHIFLLVRGDDELSPLLPVTSKAPSNPIQRVGLPDLEVSDRRLLSSPLLDILIATRDRRAQDPRDQIFGVLSLANGLATLARLDAWLSLRSLPGSPQADYSLTAAQVFTRFSEFFIQTHGAGFFLALLLPRGMNATASSDGSDPMANLPSWAADWSCGSRWLNALAVRGFELACSRREKLEPDDMHFQSEERKGGSRRVMVLQGRRRITRGWFSRHVFDPKIGYKTTDEVEKVTDLTIVDPSLVLLEMYPGVAALLRKLEEDRGIYEFQQVCAHAATKEDVAGMISRWSDVVVKGGRKHAGTADYLDAPEAFTIR